MQCDECGKDFRQNRWWQHFCSNKCRNDFHNRETSQAKGTDYATQVARHEAARHEARLNGFGAPRPKLDVVAMAGPSAAVKELVAVHRELSLHKTKMRKRVAKSELWSRSEREELSRLAEAFVKAKQPTT